MRASLLSIALTLTCLQTTWAADDADPLTRFLATYCVRCHGSETQKADRRFDELTLETMDGNAAESWQEILDQLNLGTMPPEDEEQPNLPELKRVIGILTTALQQAREAAQNKSGQVVLRRLNRAEYRNTIRDLFQLNMIDFDPTVTFPPDESTDGFDNVGDGLVTSDYLLQNYLDAARRVAQKVIRPGSQPEMISYRMGGTAGSDSDRLVLNGVSVDKEGRKEAGRLFIKFRQPLGVPKLEKRGVPADGEYVIRITAQAIRRKSRYKDEDLRYDSTEPMRLSISIDSRELGRTAHRIIGEYPIPDNQSRKIEHRVWLDKGFAFHVHWANGPDGSFKRILRKVLPRYNKDALYPIRNPPEMYVGSGPELHVQTLTIEGPFYSDWPPPGFAKYFPNPPGKPGTGYLDESMLRLADAAFRRPVKHEEIQPYLDLTHQYLAESGDFWEAAKYGVRAILTSPNFLFLAEVDSGSQTITDHELATRLSYFLWSSMPDDELRSAADSGVLHHPEVLHRHVDRMLNDPKSSALVDNFTGQWLSLRKLGEMPPDPEQNRAYYADNIEAAMKMETRLFFAHIIKEDRSILEFIDSDYTFLNADLARHYQIQGIDHEDFRKVTLNQDARRGGLLGHGSILTATSNGVETQPVNRGIWILENLLGTPPNPPPPDIEPIEPDTRGVTSIRRLMEKHRDNPTCYECHRRIDPFGLAMENFDHVGVWRDRYNKQLAIDSAAQLPDGTEMTGPDGIRAYLLARPDQFARCLTEKLFVYALGRRLNFADREDVDRVVMQLRSHNYGIRHLIREIVASRQFRSR